MKTAQTWDEAAALAEACRARGGTVVTTNGCFDLLHKGHVTYLQAARALGDMLIVGLNSDASVQRQGKGPGRPINDQDARATVMQALRCVDSVCLFDEDTPIEWLRRVRPAIHVKGGDYDASKMVETPVLAEWGGRVVTLPFVPGYSTSALIAKSQKA